METYRALYYPYIHFRDEAWVRAAALYWDQLGRIVPHGFPLRDTPTIQALRDARIVTEFDPEGADYPVSLAFRELVEDRTESLKQRYAVQRAPEDGRTAGRFAGLDGANPKLAYVSVGKMHPALIELLEREGLADTGQRDGWVGMHPRMVGVYMTSLAQVMARHRVARPITDDTTDHVSVGGPDVAHIAAALLDDAVASERIARDVEEAMASVAIESVLPTRLAEMPIDEVIDLRTRHMAQRVAFQSGVAELVSGLSGLEGPMSQADFDWHVRNEYEKHVAPRVGELTTALHDNRVDTAVGFISTQFGLPAGVGAVLGAAGVAVAPPVGIAVGVAWAAWQAVRRLRSNDANVERGNWTAYLLRIKEAGGARRVASDVGRAARAVEARAH